MKIKKVIPGRRPRSENGTRNETPQFRVRCEPKTAEHAKDLALLLDVPIGRVVDEAVALLVKQIHSDVRTGEGRYCATITPTPTSTPTQTSITMADYLAVARGEVEADPDDPKLNELDRKQAERKRRRDAMMGRT